MSVPSPKVEAIKIIGGRGSVMTEVMHATPAGSVSEQWGRIDRWLRANLADVAYAGAGTDDMSLRRSRPACSGPATWWSCSG